MTPRQRDPNARRNLSAYARGYRSISVTEEQREALRQAAHAEQMLIGDYLMMIHRRFQESRITKS